MKHLGKDAGPIAAIAIGAVISVAATVTLRALSAYDVDVTVRSGLVERAIRPAPAAQPERGVRASPVPPAPPVPPAAPAAPAVPAPPTPPVPSVGAVPSVDAPSAMVPGISDKSMRIQPSGESAPLIYIDGVRIDGSVLGGVRPGDVERIEIIKGPAAAELYGPTGANGVIQVFLKESARSGSGSS